MEWLKTILGDAYTEDIDKKVSAEIGKNFVTKTDFNAVNEAKKQLETDVKTRDGQIADLSKVDAANLQATIDKLTEDNKAAQLKYEAQLKQQKIDTALTLALTEAKARNLTAAKALVGDFGEAEIGEDGKVKGLKEKIEALKSADDSKFLFEIEEPAKFTGVEPGQGRDELPGGVITAETSYDDICKMETQKI